MRKHKVQFAKKRKFAACVFAGIRAWPEMKNNEFLSAGALLFYGLILTVLIALAILLDAIRKAPHPAIQVTAEESSVLSRLDSARLADTQHQLLYLSHFERFAVWQLILKDGMTGEYFADLVSQYGIPIASKLGEQNLAKTFDIIQSKSALLAYDQNSERWTVRSEVKDFVHYVITERLSPVFGI